MTLRKWDVWLANVMFDEVEEVKTRPVLVIDSCRILVLKMTTHEPRDMFTREYAVKEYKQAGLTRPTTIRGDRIVQLEEKDFLEKLGRLQLNDIVGFLSLIKG